jgi:AcrR family transcriptional regulator
MVTAAKRSDRTKEKILDAGLKLFSFKGFTGTTTREIAREANIAECTIFKHFPTKLAIFETLVTSYDGFQIHLSLEDLEELDYQNALLLFGKRFLDMLLNNTDLVRIYLVETFTHPEKLIGLHNHFMRRTDDIILSYFTGLKKKGLLRTLDIPEATRVLKGMILFTFQANLFLPKKGNKPINWDKELKNIIDIFVNGTTIQ